MLLATDAKERVVDNKQKELVEITQDLQFTNLLKLVTHYLMLLPIILTESPPIIGKYLTQKIAIDPE